MKRDFAPAAHRRTERRSHGRERREAQRVKRRLALLDEGIDGVEIAGLDVVAELREVRTGREVAAFVINNQPLPRSAAVADHGDCTVDHAEDIAVERASLACELKAQNAIANIPQRGRAVLFNRLAGAFDVGQNHNARRALDRREGAINLQELRPARVNAIEAFARRFLQKIGDRTPFLFEARDHPVCAQLVHQLERTELPVIAKTHAFIDKGHVWHRRGNKIEGIAQGFRQNAPSELADLVAAFAQNAQILARRFEQRNLWRDRRRVSARFKIDRLLDLAGFRFRKAIITALALAACIAVGDHLLEQLRLLIDAAIGIIGAERGKQALADQRHQIEADQIDQPEHARAGDAHRAAADFVGFFNRQAQIHRRVDSGLQPEHAKAVSNESRRVVTGNDALAQRTIAEIAHQLDGVRVRLRPDDKLEQTHITHRIEEVRDHEILAELRRLIADQVGKRNGRGVRRDNRARLTDRIDALVKVALDLRIFQNGFKNPVALFDLWKIVIDVARRNQLDGIGMHKGRRLGLCHAFDCALCQGIAISRILWNNIQKKDRNAGVGDLRRNLASHNARTDNGDLTNFCWHLICSQWFL